MFPTPIYYLLAQSFYGQMQVIKVVQLIWYGDKYNKEKARVKLHIFFILNLFCKMIKFLLFWLSNNRTYKKVF